MNNLVDTREFTRAYQALLRHYRSMVRKRRPVKRMKTAMWNSGIIVSKQAVDQALMLRGSRDFLSVAAYQVFLQNLFKRLNAGLQERYLERSEQAAAVARISLGTLCGENECVSVPGVW